MVVRFSGLLLKVYASFLVEHSIRLELVLINLEFAIFTELLTV